MPSDREELVAEVNRLYWETEIPVTEIAEKLGISRRSIYSMLIPAPADESCRICGGQLIYANRSARLAGEATCSICGREFDLALLHEISMTTTGGEAEIRAERPRAVTLTTIILSALALTVTIALLLPRRGRRRR